MQRTTRRSGAMAAMLMAAAGCSDGPGPGPTRGFPPAEPAMATALGGATVQPILSVGDSLSSGFVWAPAPDGLGGYLEGGRLVLFAAHELGGGGVPTTDGGTRFAGAR
ncbi:MAG TPA: hypothetical protein VF541_03230, partial [Longimicrobium sp.]